MLFAGGAPLLANLPEESEALGDASKCVLWVSRSAHLPRLGKKRLIPKKIKLESQREEEVYLLSLSRHGLEKKMGQPGPFPPSAIDTGMRFAGNWGLHSIVILVKAK